MSGQTVQHFKRNIRQRYQKENWNPVTDRVSMVTMGNLFCLSYLLWEFVLFANVARPGQVMQDHDARSNNFAGSQT